MSLGLAVLAATPSDLLKTYESQSGKASPTRGEQFFNAKHGKEWSCASFGQAFSPLGLGACYVT